MSETFHELIGNGFDLLREQIALRDQEETADILQWLEEEMRSICKQFDECWQRMERAEAKVNNEPQDHPINGCATKGAEGISQTVQVAVIQKQPRANQACRRLFQSTL